MRRLRLRPGATVTEEAGGRVVVGVPWGRRTLEDPPEGLRRALEALAGGAPVEDLEALVEAADLPRLYFLLESLGRGGFLAHALQDGDRPLLTVVPMTGGFAFDPAPWPAGARACLSRFAWMRRYEGDVVLESSRSLARVVLADGRASALVGSLARPAGVDDLVSRVPGLSPEAAGLALSFLVAADLAEAAGPDGTLPEDADPRLRMWEFHDLLYHSRSRQGRHDYPVGAWEPFQGQVDPLPAVKPPMATEGVDLPRADIAALKREDLPFTRVLEERRSVRARGQRPLTLQQLGEFLYRCARVRTTWPPSPEQFMLYEVAARPYPSGGGSWDLEIYAVVNRCEGLPSGLYHYDPMAHRLETLSGRTKTVERFLRAASSACYDQVEPDVLLCLTSRFGRLAWRYRAWAYSATLRNAGVLLQTMYLVATAMGLSPCAVASGDARLFAAAAGLDYFEESTISEFMLSSPPEVPYSVRTDPGVPVNE